MVAQDEDDAERLVYHACREVKCTAPLPSGFVRTTVPGATWAVFEHRGPVGEIDQTVNYIYGTWLASTPWRHTFGPDLEIYGARWHPASAESVMHYAIPIDSI